MEQTRPKNYLIESILVTIICLPFGIVGIVFASKVNSRYAAGDFEGALQASESAKSWMKWGYTLAIMAITLYLTFRLATGGFAFTHS